MGHLLGIKAKVNKKVRLFYAWRSLASLTLVAVSTIRRPLVASSISVKRNVMKPDRAHETPNRPPPTDVSSDADVDESDTGYGTYYSLNSLIILFS
jgi:hypothetical protein